MNCFDELQPCIRDIRLSETFIYQQINEIGTTGIDDNSSDERTQPVFKIAQNKRRWAINQQTAAELICRRVDASLPLLSMTLRDPPSIKTSTWQHVGIARNYLKEEETKRSGLLKERYLTRAETMAQQRTAMTMDDRIERSDVILRLNGRELLTHAGKISQQQAKENTAQGREKYHGQQKTRNYEPNLQEIEADIRRLNDE